MKLINLFKKRKPNVILILLDSVRADVLDRMPYFNELKKESVFFDNLIAYAPYTMGSIHATFSGMDGNQNGINGYYKLYSFDKNNCFTLTQYLKEAGYYTEADIIEEHVISSQGFDKVRSYGRSETGLIKRHLEILNQIKAKNPFFLFLDHDIIHTSMKELSKGHSDMDKEYYSNKERNLKLYLELVEKNSNYLDAVLEKIKELKLYDNSLILIFSDHGCSVGDKIGEFFYGVYLYDYTIRCFLYIIGKDLPKNVQIHNVVMSVDVLPTILEILGLKQKTGFKPMQGKSFLPFIYGKLEERTAYSETGGLGGPTPSPEMHNVQSVRTNKWKLIYNKTTKKKELYHLEKDSGENHNLIGKKKEIDGKLWQEMEKLSRGDYNV